MNPPTSSTNNKYRSVRQVARKFGPLAFTALAAVAEHHWLKKNDEAENQEITPTRDEPNDNDSIRSLKRQVKKLRRSLKRKKRSGDDNSDDSPSTHSKPGEEATTRPREILVEERERVVEHHQPPLQQMYPQYQPQPEPEIIYLPPQPPPQAHRRRHSHHHHQSHGLTTALIAGTVEAIHVKVSASDGLLGPRAARVATTAAAAYVAAEREGDRHQVRARDIVGYVGTGLVVSRVVFGSRRKTEAEERKRRRKSSAF